MKRFVKRPLRLAAELLEPRQYLTGLAYSSPVNTSAAALALSPVSAILSPLVTGSTRSDLVVANSTDSVSVLLSNGDGSFNSTVDTLPVTGAPLPLAVGDFNGDGIPDIAAGTAGSGAGDVSIMLGNGNGTFGAANNIPALANNHAIAVAAFADGQPQEVIAVSDSATPDNNAIVIHIGEANTPFSLPFGSVAAVATGDFNGDGHQDFVVTNQANNSVSVFFGKGDGTFNAPVTYATGPAPTSIAVGNFRNRTINGLPELDIVTADSSGGEVSFLANNGDGTFAAPVSSAVAGSATGGGPVSVRLSDLNGDGLPDLICLLGSTSTDDQATALLGVGNGTFRTGATLNIPGGSRNAVAAGDLAGAGTPVTDLVLTNSSQISALLNVTATTNQLAFAQEPAGAIAGATIAPITVDVESPAGTLLASDNSSVTLALAGGATLGGTTTVAAVNGVATFSDLSIATAGNNYTLTATDGAFVSATSTPFNIASATLPSPLVPTLGKVTLPRSVVAGAKLKAKIAVVVTNRQANAFLGNITINIFADTGTSLDGNQVLVTSLTKKVSLKADKEKTFSFSIKSLPPALADGTYHLLAQVVDPSGATNVAATTQTIQVAEAFIQPVVTVGAVAPAGIAPGKSGSIIVTLTNTGNVAAGGLEITRRSLGSFSKASTAAPKFSRTRSRRSSFTSK
jgi:hypothetical protein